MIPFHNLSPCSSYLLIHKAPLLAHRPSLASALCPSLPSIVSIAGHIGLQDVQLIRHIGSLDMGGDSGTDIGTDEEENVGGSVSPPEPPPATASTVTLRPGVSELNALRTAWWGGGGAG